MVTIFVLFLIGEAILWDSLNLSPPAALVWGKYVMNCPKNSWLHFLFSMQKSAMKFLCQKWHPSLPPGDFLQNHPIWRVQVSQYKLRHANIVYCFVTMWNLWWKSEWHACHGSVLRRDAVAVAMIRYISLTNSLWLVKRGMEQYHRKLNITKRGTKILKQWHETNGFRMTRLCVVHCTDIILKIVLTSVVLCTDFKVSSPANMLWTRLSRWIWGREEKRWRCWPRALCRASVESLQETWRIRP